MTGTGIHLQKRLSRAGKTTLIGLVAAVMSWAVLFGTLQAALAVPSEESLSPLARAGALDYSLGPDGVFESLRASFIAKVLGLDHATSTYSTPQSSSDRSILAAPLGPVATAPIPGRIPRIIVEHSFDNDDFEDAHPISAIPFTGKTHNRTAQREAGEPDGCQPLGGTVWYRHRPARNIGLLANTFGTDHAIALAVYAGSEKSNLTLIDCNINSAGNSQVYFPAKKNRTYYFQIAATTGGDLVFSLDPLGKTELVSVAHNGKEPGNRGSTHAAVSANGRYVAFWSGASNLAPRSQKMKKSCPYRAADGSCLHIYVRDMVTGRTELVSKNSRGIPSNNGASGTPAISADGRLIAFHSIGSNLVPDDNNRVGDFFVHNRRTHRTTRVSVSSAGNEGTNLRASSPYCTTRRPRTIPHINGGFREHCANNMNDFMPAGVSMSTDGRYIAFASAHHGLVKPEPHHCTDLTSHDYMSQSNHGPGVPLPVDAGEYSCRQIYVHDLQTGRTRVVSKNSDGEVATGDSAAPFISRNGRLIVFSSSADNLVPNDTNRYRDVFVHNLRTGDTRIASVSVWGEQGDAQSGSTEQRGHMSISDDGRWVTFVSHASNLDDDAGHADNLYLKDMRSGRIEVVTSVPESSSPTDLTQPMGGVHAVISADGRYIAYSQQLGNPTSDITPRVLLYVFDRITRTIVGISVNSSGEPSNHTITQEPEISADGHFVVFHSNATNLDRRSPPDDRTDNVYIHELPWTR